jgi:hypothetical protein
LETTATRLLNTGLFATGAVATAGAGVWIVCGVLILAACVSGAGVVRQYRTDDSAVALALVAALFAGGAVFCWDALLLVGVLGVFAVVAAGMAAVAAKR